ncbi:MAG: cytochrome d ubiquinol oxidase subunit II [Bryobacterales bacterium]|nr:cytochrome d ubiquinol oxidase subunit II [Acidobacteriota bacterium]MCB9385845.1 cytochrome d ubiquinol oxidase subunit II [Bryobacterales bacterium]
MDLQTIWFILLGVLLGGYAALDGFDFGVGILHPLAKTDAERRTFMNAIGPIWDGNEVWLITFGGALFAAFPMAYATAFSGMYLALMLVLAALIFRAVAIEFRSKRPGAGWRATWDWAFFGSSLVASLLFGVAAGNAVLGMPLDERGVFTGTFLGLLHPYALLTGVLTVALFAMHGSLYLGLKIQNEEFRERIRGWSWHAWGVFLALYLLTTIYTLMQLPHATKNFEQMPWAFAAVALNVFAVANIPRALFAKKPGQAFLSSVATIFALVFLLAVALWPNLIAASNDPNNSLTIYRAASSEKTLDIMLTIAMIGIPFVLGYTAAIYWTFRGAADVGEKSY